MKFKSFFKPTFTTANFEAAKTRNGQVPKITSLGPVLTKGHPQKVFGKLSHNGKTEKVEWNQYGECRKYYPAARCRRWDLVHPDHSQVESVQEYFIGLVIFVIMLAIAGLF